MPSVNHVVVENTVEYRVGSAPSGGCGGASSIGLEPSGALPCSELLILSRMVRPRTRWNSFGSPTSGR
ncbi:hypothetical protein E8D34_02670 [Nocardioides sp. GY 10113]|uniref:hypothetical protein n=1 Tax=Nocardioides sp. GY 10113 TaxID=2569761 RepID=UPI0010A79743|nr:hypothetical protein [Nocardioides sp. GY 10113]TIC88604.1 hypothetical protein E8D34_02670 [Nocardioides sp. GY 10113]